jgi:hypothetical protein
MGGVKVIRAKVLSVDKVKWTCTVQGEFDNQTFSGISVQPTYVTSAGGGQFYLPEVNSLVYLCFPSTDSTPFIMGGATAPAQLDEGDDSEDPNDHRQNRPVLNEGDMLVASSGTARVIVRRGGLLEIGASESAKRVYIPLQNLIQEFSQNYTHETGGGLFSMRCRDDDETYGSERTPAEFQIQWREFCEDEFPIIDLRMGRIKAEDDERILNATQGEIVYRFNINNRHRVWIDKRGNAQIYRHGATYESYNGPRFERHEQSLSHIVRQTLTAEYGVQNTKVARTSTLEVGRDREIRVTGGLTETIGAGIFRQVYGAIEEELGDITRTVTGSVVEQVLNNTDTTIGGNHTVSVGLSEQKTVAKSSRTLVPGGGNLPTDTTWELVVTNGKTVLHNTLGKNVLSVGPTQEAPTCVIRQKVTGSIEISSGLGVTLMEINGTGMRVSTVGGEIALDQIGTVTLGPGPVRGNVVTTLSHPFDFITGLPILGTTSVQAGMVAALPGPAAVPSGFLPDLTP